MPIYLVYMPIYLTINLLTYFKCASYQEMGKNCPLLFTKTNSFFLLLLLLLFPGMPQMLHFPDLYLPSKDDLLRTERLKRDKTVSICLYMWKINVLSSFAAYICELRIRAYSYILYTHNGVRHYMQRLVLFLRLLASTAVKAIADEKQTDRARYLGTEPKAALRIIIL